MTDRGYERANDESRARLIRMAATLTDIQLATDLGEGWTVASALAHTGFWDRWQAERWSEMLAGRWDADDASFIVAEHLANDALHPYWAGIDAAGIPALAVEAATRLDALIAAAPDALVEQLEGSPSAFLLHRHRHRGDHLDHIERSIAAAQAASPVPAGLLDRSFVGRNAESRRRLVELVDRLTPADMARQTEPTEEGSWNVAQVLGHLAFWDRSMETRWLAAVEAAGAGLGPVRPVGIPLHVADIINGPLAALLAGLTAQAGMAIASEAVAAAEAVDALIESLADRIPGSLLEESPRAFQRWPHRDDHIRAIERATGGSQKGQGLAEYALILALIAIVAVSALLFLGGGISTIVSAVGARA